MNRRKFLAMLAAPSAGLPARVLAQKATRAPTVGILVAGEAGIGMVGPGGTAGKDLVESFRALDYVEGTSITFVARAAERRIDRLPELAAELVRLRCDVIVTGGSEATAAAKQATTSIPIVFSGPSYPVEEGLVTSLARPGGNVTGFTLAQADHVAKHLQLLRELVPALGHVAILYSPDNRGSALFMRDTQALAGTLGLRVLALPVRHPQEVERALVLLDNAKPGAAMVSPVPAITGAASSIVAVATKLRIPTISSVPIMAERGILLSYGADPRDLEPRVAGYVDRILRGARPAELPVQQPTKLALVVNLRTARAIGMTVPQGLLQRADRVIE